MFTTPTYNSHPARDTASPILSGQSPDVHPMSLLTVEEMAALLRIGRNSAYRLVKEGAIQSVRIGRAIRIPRTAIDTFINNAAATS